MDAQEKRLLLWLREAIAQRRFTQVEVARSTGVDQSQISRILAGQSKRNSENVLALCRFAAEAARPTAVATNTPTPTMTQAQELLTALMHGGDAAEQQEVVDLLARLVSVRNIWRRGRKREP